MLTSFIHRVVAREDLTQEEASQALGIIMDGQATDVQVAALLVALRMKGETAQEVAGFARAMRDHAVHIPTKRADVVDTCGTGGDALDTFNISTCAAFVAAGAGVPIAKHGNRAVSSTCGSADVLQQLGVNLDLDASAVARCIDEIGIGFLFAPKLHPAMRYAMGPRKELSMRTVFNMLGPLTNPAMARRQVLGVFGLDAARLMAGALASLGTDHALIVHGDDGLDEVSLTGPTHVFEVRGSQVGEAVWEPEQFGLQRCRAEEIAGAPPEPSAQILREVLSGEAGPRRDIALLNAAAAIYVSGLAASPVEGLAAAAESVDAGAALGKLDALIEMSNNLSGPGAGQ
jgi:anthranilate phosphoribosyltransferase